MNFDKTLYKRWIIKELFSHALLVRHWEAIKDLTDLCAQANFFSFNPHCKTVCMINTHNFCKEPKVTQIVILEIISVNALYHILQKSITVTKAFQEPQYQKHKKWHLVYFSADNYKTGCLEEHQSNGSLLLLETSPKSGSLIITRITLTTSPTLWFVFDF